MAITVFGGPFSPFVRKVLVTLEHKGLDYELNPMSPFPPSEELLKLNPKGQIPAFTDGDLTLADSTVICQYLEDQYPQNTLLPDTPDDRAKARWLACYSDTTLASAVGGPYFFQKIVKPLFMRKEPDTDLVVKAEQQLIPDALAYLEQQLVESTFCVGDQFSTADVALGSQLHNLATAGYQIPDQEFPNLARYTSTVADTPQFQRRRAHDDAILKKFQS